MYFIWRNKPRSVLGHTLNWIPGSEITNRLEEVGCFTSAETAREYVRAHYAAGKVSVLNRKVFQQKIKMNKLPQFRVIETTTPGLDAAESGHLVYAEYLEKIGGKAGPGKNTAVFPSANVEKTSETEVITSMRHLLTMVLDDMRSLEEREMDLKDKIWQLDLVTSDRLHQIELCNLSEESSVSCIAALKENLILRRRYKNELLSIQAAKDALKGIDTASVKHGLQQIDGLGKQIYHCRVLTDKDPIVQASKKGVDS